MSETVHYSGHPSWRSYSMYYVCGMALAIVVAGTDHAGAAVLFPLATFGVAAWKRYRDNYAVTSARVSRSVGILSKTTDEIPVRYISGIRVRQNILERILGIGTIEFSSMNDMTTGIVFRGVTSPQEIKEKAFPNIG